jgi:hypothetical protein
MPRYVHIDNRIFWTLYDKMISSNDITGMSRAIESIIKHFKPQYPSIQYNFSYQHNENFRCDDVLLLFNDTEEAVQFMLTYL